MKRQPSTSQRIATILSVLTLLYAGSVLASSHSAQPQSTIPSSESQMQGNLHGLLDGKHFAGQIDANGAGSSKEMIYFKNGYLHSSTNDQKGFSMSRYTATNNGASVAFAADAENQQGNKLHWEGTVTGNTIDATATYTEKGKDPVVMRATGASRMPNSGVQHQKQHAAPAVKSTTKATTATSQGQ